MMKRCVRVLGFLAFTLAASASNLTPVEAAKHVGENATVCGVVASVHTASSSKGSPTFVNLDKPYPNQIFTVLIWGNDRGKFVPAPASWEGKQVCVTGVVTLYRSIPEIVARDASQVSFPK